MLAVEAKGLSKSYDGVRAVKNITFSVLQGELFCVVGPDGAGKSTFIRLLSGIIKPTAGRARILGFDLTKEIDEIKKRIGYLSQRFTLYGDLSVDENLEFFAEIHGIKDFKSRREELLGFTRLGPFRRRLAENLSGGMKQKLALACALIHTPELLLLDEPTTGVDPLSRRDFWKILFGLLQRGVTIILSTPYLDEAERASRVALMHEGSFLAVETPRGIKKRMEGTIIELAGKDLRAASELAKNMPGVIDVQAFGDRLHLVVSKTQADPSSLNRLLQDRGIIVSHWRQISPSLENVFIYLMGDSQKGVHG
ncbi:MAG: ABC transporter ATP-binding protein [Clostridiales bacterium]|nr:ABC transporter ATP-binding protein [Clostridiales bacterium]